MSVILKKTNSYVFGVTKCIPIRMACGNFSDSEDHNDDEGVCGNVYDKLSFFF